LKPHLRKYAWSFVFALALTVLVGAIASLPRWSAVGVLLAPGMLAAAIVFPDGINSNWGKTYLVLAALMNAFVLAWPVLWFSTWIERFRRRE
jgi:small neutral amino acid transporter SnatA (MarC family)